LGPDCDYPAVAAFLSDLAGYATVQEAIDAAAPGATVTVCPGPHIESLTVPPGQEMTLSPSASGLGILQAPPGARALDVGAGAVVTLRQLTVEGDAGFPVEGDGGLIRVLDAELSLVGVSLRTASTCGSGGGLSISTTSQGAEAALRIFDSVLSGTNAEGNGGLVAAWAAADSHIRLEVVASRLTDGGAGGSGGLLSLDGPGDLDLHLDRAELSAGRAGWHGGALAVLARPATVEVRMDSSDLHDSTADQSGGLVFINSDERSDVRRVEGSEDQLYGGQAGTNGGALRVAGFGEASLSFLTITLVENKAAGRGGALFAVGPELSNVYLDLSGEFEGALRGNLAGDVDSAALEVGYGCAADLGFILEPEGGHNTPAVLRTVHGSYANTARLRVFMSCSSGQGDCYVKEYPVDE
jgi:hypothetical protein